MSKYNKKKKFVNRGVYILTTGKYEGSFALNIKELDTATHKKLIIMVPSVEDYVGKDREDKGVQVTMELVDMTVGQISDMFTNECFEYIETMPKSEYNQWKAAIIKKEGHNDSRD
jgi:hypothetical protein